MNNRMRGKVLWFNDAKGYGFIRSDEIESDIFIHYSQIITDGFKTVTEGMTVEFDLIDTIKNKTAINVVKITEGFPIEDKCYHQDHEDNFCLDCGEDLTEYLVSRAEHYSDILNDR